LGEVCTDLIVHQKQIGIGLPLMNREEVIKQPLPPLELKKLIYKSCGEDSSTAVLTQELLSYLSMFIKTEPGLFKEMLEIRVGLIMEVLAAEYARVSGLAGEEAADHLMNIAPFQMKNLLYYILSGKEFTVKTELTQTYVIGLEKKGSMNRVKNTVKKMSRIIRQSTIDSPSHGYLANEIGQADDTGRKQSSGEQEFQQNFESLESLDKESSGHANKVGQWLRRRCLYGALNRVPVGFYAKMWNILDRSQGLSVQLFGFSLEHKLTQENTSGEMKFALKVEEELNKMTYPEYRQLVVESLLVLALVMENDTQLRINWEIKLDDIVNQAHYIFLRQQRSEGGDAMLCCANFADHEYYQRVEQNQGSPCSASNNICRYFYDSAPSGAYGTMTYFAQAILGMLYGEFKDSPDKCRIG